MNFDEYKNWFEIGFFSNGDLSYQAMEWYVKN
jgi:hypothetical protein